MGKLEPGSFRDRLPLADAHQETPKGRTSITAGRCGVTLLASIKFGLASPRALTGCLRTRVDPFLEPPGLCKPLTVIIHTRATPSTRALGHQ